MSTLDTECRREYYRIDDQIALQIRLHDSNDEEDSLIFNTLSELHQLELDAQPLLRTVSEHNRSIEQYFKVINKRIDLLGQMFVHTLLNDIGPPPITRWDYTGFSVYFEYSTVINSVKNHQAKYPISP